MTNENSFQFRDWEEIELATRSLFTENPSLFDSATIRNVHDFLRRASRSCPLPDGTCKGYWNTIRILWKNAEVEIFDDRYELYLFAQGKADISYFDHQPETDVPP